MNEEEPPTLERSTQITWRRVHITYADGIEEELEYSYRGKDPLTRYPGGGNPRPNKIFDHRLDNPQFYGDNSGIYVPKTSKDERINPMHIMKVKVLEEKTYSYEAEIIDCKNGYARYSDIEKDVSQVKASKQ